MGGGRVGTVLCLAALAVPAVSLAQPAYAGADREARDRFELGREAFSRGDYAVAVAQFEQAYVLSRRSALLYNVGAAYDRLHRWAEASAAFQRYLTENPMAPDRPEVESRLRMISAELDRQRSMATVASAAQGGPAAAPQVLVVERPAELADPPRPWRTVFWAAGALTLAAGGVTLVLGVVSNQRYNALVSSCAPGCLAIDVDDMRQRQLFVNVGIATTAVLAAGTAAAFVLDYLRPRASASRESYTAPRAALVPTPGGALLTVVGRL